MNEKTVAIIGLGALGVLYGQHLSEALGKNRVRVVVNQERKRRYEREGVTLNGIPCDFNYVLESEKSTPADLIIVCTKSLALDSALNSMKNQVGDESTILSLINGISSEGILGREFGYEKVIPTVAIGMDATRDGQNVRSKVKGWLQIGVDRSDKQKRLEAVKSIFDEAQFPYAVEEDITLKIWEKFMMNVGVNQVVMVNQSNFGGVQTGGEYHDQAKSAMEEVVMIAQAERIKLENEHIQKAFDIIDTVDSDGMPSMRQDGLAKRLSEVELFSGTILKKAEKYGLDCPVNRYLYEEVQKIEAEYS
ncbi:ketopantoate reductase family protein [Alkalibacterium pelagium]|uniref:2-dehydropantoate 2-reductase n=1 Tax=Alkalibacterium pelagium TaxID=426702 RepID=A0A1H7EUR9_9LACT|nr:ketopantoate reductase family protein [Alkalibacterium pelagium]GEN49638.1 2-dehydropantoate 2-reductase [Alkalibacterium pelagium]SEK17643.1 2-dehydropantoate 2-reductase [Alkalibacterium pelagium]